MTGWMKALAAIALLALAGCTNLDPQELIPGKWKASITDAGQTTDIELTLRLISMEIEGEFTPVTETGGGVKSGVALRILRTRLDGQKLFFTVPLSGNVDDKSLVFELTLSPGRLDGFVHRRASGSQSVPVTFIKEKG
jgi:hypothetical protein